MAVTLCPHAEDVGEKKDLAAKMPEKVAELGKLLDAWLLEVDATMCPPNPSYDPSKPLGGPIWPRPKAKNAPR